MDVANDWIRPVFFVLLAVWIFSFLLWDFILAVIKTWERVRSDEANIFDLKLETQCFVGGSIFTGWGLYQLYGWFENPDLVACGMASGAFLIAVWFNRALQNKWRSTGSFNTRRSV